MRIIKLYTDGSYNKDEIFTDKFIPNSMKLEDEYVQNKIGKAGLVVHGGFVSLNVDDEPLAFVRVNCSVKEFVKSWSCGGEVSAVMVAVQWADQYIKMMNTKYGAEDSEIHIYHDYIGISEWIKPVGKKKWKANSDCALNYVKLMNLIFNKNSYGLKFIKVNAHTGNKWNEVADCLAGNKSNVYITKEVEVINL